MFVIFFKTIILALLVFFVIRLMGKKQIGEMQPFEFVITLILAEVACLPMNDSAIPLFAGIIPIITLAFLHIFISFLAQKSFAVRKLVDGHSVIVIDRGSVVYENLRRMNMNMNDLIEMTRSGGYPDFMDIEYAIVETNGKISVVEKPSTGETKPLLPISLLIDGKRIKRNIETAGTTDAELTKLIKSSGVKSDKDVLYIDVRQNGETYMSLKRGGFKCGKIRVGGSNW